LNVRETCLIVGIGDSTTAGTPLFVSPVEAPPSGRGDPLSQYGYWVTAGRPRWTFLNKGVNGERTDQLLRRFERDVVAPSPDIVVILAGVNDVYQGRGPGVVKANLEAIYSLADASGVKSMGATILPYNSASPAEAAAIREVNSWIGQRCREPGMLYCDTNLAARDPDDPDRLATTADGLHPDIQGYRRMGEAVAQALLEAGY
jgi:acyl-CoA thioesterase-1